MDGVILVAIAAVSIWVSRAELIPWLQVLSSIDIDTWARAPLSLSYSWGWVILHSSQAAVAIPTLGFTLLRFVNPRPSVGRLCKQPGFTATLAASFAILIGGAVNYGTSNPKDSWEAFVCGVALMPRGAEPGIAVASAWLLLLLGRQWRPEPSWIDRLGRLLGGYWLFMILIAGLRAKR
jgi:hypothetical protein